MSEKITTTATIILAGIFTAISMYLVATTEDDFKKHQRVGILNLRIFHIVNVLKMEFRYG